MLTKDTGIIDAVQNHPEILEVLQNTPRLRWLHGIPF